MRHYRGQLRGVHTAEVTAKVTVWKAWMADVGCARGRVGWGCVVANWGAYRKDTQGGM